MTRENPTRSWRIARLKLSAIVALVIVAAVIFGIVLRLLEWL